MTINEAMRLVSKEYDQECKLANVDPAFDALVSESIGAEYNELDQELPKYVGDIAAGYGAPPGTVLPEWVYQMARMCFRMGMRTQRKLERPNEATSLFWRSDQKAV
jgi:hypothetical protein